MNRDLSPNFFNDFSLHSDLLKAAITALFAVAVFVLGQLIERMFIVPIQEQKKVLGRILYALTFHANKFPFRDEEQKLTNLDDLKNASSELRELAANLRATSYSIPLYDWLNQIRIVPKNSDMKEVARSLIGWSNSLYEESENHRYKFRKKIAQLLHVELE